ncbi:putative mucin/carbohydrate-binding domain-containing protein [Spiroplasma endosymbiont of Polydrusus pterygomalis]|uniref:putative mucin/carbohydrate-binding domain-containing protein n=1 Tax=Spiroplasma endosymbiont of Polydrusus pterygomalis TaxID=3139327 RepID=UPI003CCAA2C2
MKKLLSLLSVLTIGGSALPTTIACSSYEKEEIKLENNGIIYSQTNNLENLIRNKRSWNNSVNKNIINMQWLISGPDYFFLISRENWIKTRELHKRKNNFESFKQEFIDDILYSGFWKDYRLDSRNSKHLNRISKSILSNFSYLDEKYMSSRVNCGFDLLIWDDSSLRKDAFKFQCSNDYSWYKEKIKFNELGDNYKGEIGLDIDSKKILFFGNDIPFHNYFNSELYNQIIIKDQNNNIIKDIKIMGNDSMQDIINKKYNIENGVNYDYGYIIELWSAEPKRTLFVMNNNDTYSHFVDSKSRLDKFIIINDKLLEFDFYKKEHFSLMLEWEENFNIWKNELNRQIKEDVPSFTEEQKRTWKGDKYNQLKDKIHSLKQDLKIIENSENINKLKHKITKLQKDINDLKQQISELNQKIDKIRNDLEGNQDLETCTKVGSIISVTTGWIPVIGTLISTISGTVSAICDIANA